MLVPLELGISNKFRPKVTAYLHYTLTKKKEKKKQCLGISV